MNKRHDSHHENELTSVTPLKFSNILLPNFYNPNICNKDFFSLPHIYFGQYWFVRASGDAEGKERRKLCQRKSLNKNGETIRDFVMRETKFKRESIEYSIISFLQLIVAYFFVISFFFFLFLFFCQSSCHTHYY